MALPATFGNRQMAYGGSQSNIIPFASGGRGAIVSQKNQVKGGLPVFNETYDERTLNADAQYELAKLPWEFKDRVWNTVNPLLTGLLGGGGQATFGQVGGENTPLPRLPNSFVFSPEQTQMAVNSARAQGDQGTATQKEQIASEMAGRGFSKRSPIAMALNLAADTGGRMSNADQEREIRLAHTDRNAKQDLSVGTLAQQQWRDFNQMDVARRQSQVDSILNGQRSIAALISALGGLG